MDNVAVLYKQTNLYIYKMRIFKRDFNCSQGGSLENGFREVTSYIHDYRERGIIVIVQRSQMEKIGSVSRGEPTKWSLLCKPALCRALMAVYAVTKISELSIQCLIIRQTNRFLLFLSLFLISLNLFCSSLCTSFLPTSYSHPFPSPFHLIKTCVLKQTMAIFKVL